MASPTTPQSKSSLRHSLGRILKWLFVVFVAPSYSKGSLAMEQSRDIYELMVSYAEADGGVFPSGSSSTEVFQKLVDANHFVASGKTFGQILSQVGYNEMKIRDTAIFFLDMPGKRLATSAKLKPENVCFDVTVPLDGPLPDGLPVVFTTGYKIEYSANKTAIPLLKSNLPDWAAVSYAGGNSYDIWSDHSWSSQLPLYFLQDHLIAAFIPSDFDPKGTKYQQLTPDGPLAQ